ncbi:9856_t:CDS:2 [Paraglomus brasilianum]|uniref:9856_t:CDS:1 n=1 Tax=Paraglomus brasilianum TaxID=144538 RepID=A0A9N9BEB8_9GLOM|nr:9856_t:CDS:2 [Paraglomus brasilianum]
MVAIRSCDLNSLRQASRKPTTKRKEKAKAKATTETIEEEESPTKETKDCFKQKAPAKKKEAQYYCCGTMAKKIISTIYDNIKN